jgi:SHAQKYF class myb-like DNA-binding protein
MSGEPSDAAAAAAAAAGPPAEVGAAAAAGAGAAPKRALQGRWKDEEHAAFEEGMRIFGTNWAAVQRLVPSRTVLQVRSHAQKFFQRMQYATGEPLSAAALAGGPPSDALARALAGAAPIVAGGDMLLQPVAAIRHVLLEPKNPGDQLGMLWAMNTVTGACAAPARARASRAHALYLHHRHPPNPPPAAAAQAPCTLTALRQSCRTCQCRRRSPLSLRTRRPRSARRRRATRCGWATCCWACRASAPWAWTRGR